MERVTAVAVAGEAACRARLARKGEAAGFGVLDAAVTDLGVVVGCRPEPVAARAIRLRLVRFDGALEVVDPARLAAAARQGVGSGKGFGGGLLSVRAPE